MAYRFLKESFHSEETTSSGGFHLNAVITFSLSFYYKVDLQIIISYLKSRFVFTLSLLDNLKMPIDIYVFVQKNILLLLLCITSVKFCGWEFFSCELSFGSLIHLYFSVLLQ